MAFKNRIRMSLLLTVLALCFSVPVWGNPESPALEAEFHNESLEKDLLISVSIKNNPGLMGFGLIVSYDAASIEPIKVESGDLFGGGTLVDNIGVEGYEGMLKVYWADSKEKIGDGEMVKLCFRPIADESKVSTIRINTSSEDTFRESLQEVSIQGTECMINLLQDTTGYTNQTTETILKQISQSGVSKTDIKKIIHSAASEVGFDSISEIEDVQGQQEAVKKISEDLKSIGIEIEDVDMTYETVCDLDEQLDESSSADNIRKTIADAISEKRVREIISNALEEVGVEEFSQMDDEQKRIFLKQTEEALNTESEHLKNDLSEYSDEERLEAYETIYLDSSEKKHSKFWKKQKSKKIQNKRSMIQKILLFGGILSVLVLVIGGIVFCIEKRRLKSRAFLSNQKQDIQS